MIKVALVIKVTLVDGARNYLLAKVSSRHSFLT